MSTPFDSILTLVKAANTENLPVSIGERNAKFTNQLVIDEYNGIPDRQLPIEQPFIRIQIYHLSQRSCKDIAWSIYIALKQHANHDQKVGDYRIVNLVFTKSPTEINPPDETDQGKLWCRVMNFYCQAI